VCDVAVVGASAAGSDPEVPTQPEPSPAPGDADASGRADATEQPGGGNAGRDESRPSRIPAVLVIVATLLAVASCLSTWVRTQMLDTDEWSTVSEELLADPEIQDALAVYLSNELFEQVDVQAVVADRLPDELAGLAGPLVGAVREPITNGIEDLVASDRFRQLWVESNRRAHERFVAILRDETPPGFSTADGTVTLEIGTMLRSVGESIGLPEDALDRIPEDAGQIVVLESDQLSDVQAAVRVLDFLSWFLFVAVVGLYALAVYLARGRRTQVFRLVGVGLAVGGLLLIALQSIGVRITVDDVVRNPSNGPAAEAVALIATSLLRSMAWTGIVFGLLIVGAALLVDDHRHATALRRRLASSDSALIVPAAAGTIAVALLWWNPADAFDGWITVLALVALIAVTAVMLNRRLAEGEPERTTVDLGD